MDNGLMFDAILNTVTALLEHYLVAHNKLPLVPPLFCNEAPSDTQFGYYGLSTYNVFAFSFFFSSYEMKKNIQIMELKKITHPSSRSNIMFMGSKDSRKMF